MKEILLGNMAIALGAVHAGVKLSADIGDALYQGAESVAHFNRMAELMVEWSTTKGCS